ncbi:unnamed protein product [Didymodactylos carnosus]|uniref:L-type lectin-like domain-containing protein n=1 Tax=Didymodactylos carnosus TaxID=1234261 RepID=A0A813PQE9_9BILA|nr:unnamed protein product [Didymodactylos carnosus]CAF0920982.1 unnamed protein product [Didymodactylos carnosus]CAF3539539.1 unnamed protein product [Didymodactylos carnosus]CAF3698481.1 unnamed protein product [Didymodactylos carnosus]
MQCCLILLFLIPFISTYTDPSATNPELIKRFEYKLSFKGPHLVFKDGTIPFWSFGGSKRCPTWWIWCQNVLTADNWVLDVKLRVMGRGRTGADGMAVWFTEKPGVEGPVFGSNDLWKGLGIFLDSFDNDALQNNPIIAVMVNDGTKQYDHQHDGTDQIQGSCIRDFRNKPLPIRLKIEFFNNVLTLYINNGLTQDDNAFEFCTRVEQPNLPKSGYLGVSAATGGLADDHDVIEFLSYTYINKQSMNQANEEQMKKYNEEYEKYDQDLKKQREDYQKDHPDAPQPTDEKSLYESEYDREFRQILETQGQMRYSLVNIDRQMAELLGRIERYQGINQIVSTGIQGDDNIPSDIARVQDINHVISSQSDVTKTIQSLSHILDDLQQKINYLQNQPPSDSLATPTDIVTKGSLSDNMILNELMNIIKAIKQETNVLMLQSGTQTKCPISNSGTCLGRFLFLSVISVQIVAIIGYFTYKNRQERVSRKYV